MPNYNYIQQVGGDEAWKAIPSGLLADYVAEHKPNFVTVHAVSKIVTDLEPDDLDKLTYQGPLNFDFDGTDIAFVAAKCNALLDKLEGMDLDLSSIQIYATGGKGFHLEIPQACFMEKVPKPGTQNLPTAYREVALSLYVDTLDLRVYSQRKGRMWRVPGNLRKNGKYKVPLTVAEMRDMTVESYDELTSQARSPIPRTNPKLCVDLTIEFSKAAEKVATKLKQRGKHKKDPLAKAKASMPSVQALMDGRGLKTGLGFHEIALQVAIATTTAGLSSDQMIAACAGLIQKHESDGSRYNSEAKRAEELRRMHSYCDDNPCYVFSVGAIKSLLTHSAPDLDSITTDAQDVEDAIAEAAEPGKLGPDGEAVPDEFADTSGGVTLSKFGVYADSEFGKKRICAVSFSDIHLLLSTETGQINCYEAQVLVNGRSTGRQTMELDTFSSVQMFNRFCARLGHAMQGSEMHVRGLMMRFVELAKKKGRMRYVAKREGLDVVNIPNHADEALREPFSVWADTRGVILDPRLKQGQLEMSFQGYPTASGLFKTDLADAPQLAEWLDEGENKEALRKTLRNLFTCQKPEALGKLLGWYCAANYRMFFHRAYPPGQFPLLHVNGPAGVGKTAMQVSLMSLFYYNQTPKVLTPGSSLFGIQQHMAASASIPLILDEYKPAGMSREEHAKYKGMFRDAYNCRGTAKGGGNRDSEDYRSLYETQLSAPLVFIAEAAEEESAVSERVVLVTLARAASSMHSTWALRYGEWSRNGKMLTILGKWLVSEAVQTATVEGLRREFDPLYAEAREKYLFNAADLEKNLSSEVLMRKQNAKERTVFNFTVARFGLNKLRGLVEAIYGEAEFKGILDEMSDGIYDRMADLQSATQAEWAKVLDMMAHISHHVPPDSTYALLKNTDYAFVDVGGRDCIEIALRNAYIRYRGHARGHGMAALYINDQSFVHSIKDSTALMSRDSPQVLRVPGVYTFDLEELARLGVQPFKG